MLPILKTYKLFIGGQFPRTESGRAYKVTAPDGSLLANACLASRKDFRNAVVAARKAFDGWSQRAAFNRSQILYRIAEMMEGRTAQFEEELRLMGLSKAQAAREVRLSIERFVYYSGWCDKYQQVFGSVNPVSSPHFNFSVPEPTGVVAIVADEQSPLLGLVSVLAPAIAGGNTCVLLASESRPLSAVTLAEVLSHSDLPGGVVNILTGRAKELHTHMAGHMDVNALVYCRDDQAQWSAMATLGAQNVKRTMRWMRDWTKEDARDPYLIMDLQEIKTTWHPMERIGASGSGY